MDLRKIIDKDMGSAICYGLGLFPKKKSFKKNDKILVIKLSAIGESILALPMIKSLKDNFPNARIDILCTKQNKQVFIGQEFVNKIYNVKSAPKLFKRYDLVFDCEPFLNLSAILSKFCGKYVIGFGHGARARVYDDKVYYDDKKHVVSVYLDMLVKFKVSKLGEKLVELKFSKRDEKEIDIFLSSCGVKKSDFLVGICSDVGKSAKQRIWPIERVAELCDKVIEKYGAKIILLGADRKLHGQIISRIRNKSNIVNSAGRTSLAGLFYLVKNCDLVISNDTGTMHMAAAQGCRTIGLFGPNLPERFGPYGDKNKGLYAGRDLLCSPCINVHRGKIPDRCVNEEYKKCMKNISVDDILKEVKRCVK